MCFLLCCFRRAEEQRLEDCLWRTVPSQAVVPMFVVPEELEISRF